MTAAFLPFLVTITGSSPSRSSVVRLRSSSTEILVIISILLPRQILHRPRDVVHSVVFERADVLAHDAVLVGHGELGAVEELVVGGELEAVDAEVADGGPVAGEERPAGVVADFLCVGGEDGRGVAL